MNSVAFLVLLCLLLLLSLSLLDERLELLVVSDNYADQAVASLIGKDEILSVPWGRYERLAREEIQCRGDKIDKVYIIGGPAAVREEYIGDFYWEEMICRECFSIGDLEVCSDVNKGLYCAGAIPGNCWLLRHNISWERVGGPDRRYTALEAFLRFDKDTALVCDGGCEASVYKALEEARTQRGSWWWRIIGREKKVGLIYEWPYVVTYFTGASEFSTGYSGILVNLSQRIGAGNIHAISLEPECYTDRHWWRR